MGIDLRRIIVLSVLMSACCWAQTGTASGSLKVNGKTFQIKEAYLLAVEDPAKNIEETVLLLSDRALPGKVLTADPNIFELRDTGMNGLQMRFYSDGENYSMLLIGGGIDGSYSSSGTFDRDRFKTYQTDRVAGSASDKRETGGTAFEYQISFDATPVSVKPAAPPAPGEIEAARNSAPAKAYMAHNQALREGNVAKIAAGVVPERAAQIKDPQFKEMIELIQAMMPSDIAVLRASITGDEAELELTGKEDGKTKSGVASLKNIGGKWLVVNESWK